MKKIFYVTLTPNARLNRITIESQENETYYIKAYVTAIPEDGKANVAIIEQLSLHLKLPKTRFKLLRGGKSRKKVIVYEE